jgi:hypothetical protein
MFYTRFNKGFCIFSNTYIAPASKVVGSGYLQQHTSEDYGFIFTSYENETVISWKYFSKPYVLSLYLDYNYILNLNSFFLFFYFIRDDKGKFDLINEGKSYQQSPLVDYSIINMIDGSYGLFITNRVNKTEFIKPSEFTVKIYLSFIKPTMNSVNGPFLIYQSTIPQSKVGVHCNAAYTGTCIVCFLLLESVKPKKFYTLKLLVQNSGFVI